MFECETCKGTGIRYLPAPGSDPDDCPDCGGKGYLIPDELVESNLAEFADKWSHALKPGDVWIVDPRELLRDALAAVFDQLGFGDAETIRWCKPHNAESVENHGHATDECWRVVWADDPPDGS